MAAGPKLDGAGVQKMKTLEDATTMLHRLHGLVETYAMAVKKSQPTSFTIQQIRRSLPPLIGLLKGQFGMIADQVAALNLIASRGSNEQTRLRVLREGVGSIRIAMDIAMVRVKENHGEKEAKDLEVQATTPNEPV
ncbi:MAG TPA: hypothetical protein VKA54_11430 [Gemmatimonadaceae bacterium]|nr:hypothetical protein [Gemmatimonadaceae bacterium]